MIEGIYAMMHGKEKQREYSFIAGCERVKQMGMSILDDCCFTVYRMVKYRAQNTCSQYRQQHHW